MPKGLPKNGTNRGWFKKGFKMSDDWKEKIGLDSSRRQKGKPKSNMLKEKFKLAHTGIKLSEKHKEAIRKGHLGEKSHFWKGGISSELYSVDWTDTLKRSIRERDNYICQICSKYGYDVHHTDYNKRNCNPNNLITLCHKCHMKTNGNRNKWTKYFKNKLKI